jgi:putative hydrolase of the HAD superfamily
VKISTLFFDIGGVILTNGWDNIARKEAAEKFNIDFDEFEKKHQDHFEEFEKGNLSLVAYLDETIFYTKRKFTRFEVIKYMHSFSQTHDKNIEILKKLSAQNKYYIASINNESSELNLYRIKKFDLEKYFNAFFSSCFLKVRKPDAEIYQNTLNILHKDPSECIFIDDREENIESAKKVGLNAFHLDNANNLNNLLTENGIKI